MQMELVDTRFGERYALRVDSTLRIRGYDEYNITYDEYREYVTPKTREKKAGWVWSGSYFPNYLWLKYHAEYYSKLSLKKKDYAKPQTDSYYKYLGDVKPAATKLNNYFNSNSPAAIIEATERMKKHVVEISSKKGRAPTKAIEAMAAKRKASK